MSNKRKLVAVEIKQIIDIETNKWIEVEVLYRDTGTVTWRMA